VIYRDVLAEVRRLHGEAPWRLTGVVVDGEWYPAADGIGPATMRQVEAGLVEVRSLPRFLAVDDDQAVSVALDVAGMAGLGEAGPRRHEVVTG
jgi:hypothetical protein